MFKSILSFLLLLFLFNIQSISQIKVINLKCEHLENPIGIDESHPRFTWQLKSEKPGSFQNAYQLLVGTNKTEVAAGNGNVWESGTVNSSVIPVVYNGVELQAFTRYFWSVRVQDEKGERSGWSPVAWFETGMMHQNNWK